MEKFETKLMPFNADVPPTMESVSPEYAELVRKKDELATELSDLIHVRLPRLAHEADAERRNDAAPRKENPAVRALLGDGSAPVNRSSKAEELDAAKARVEALREAIHIVTSRIDEARHRASVMVMAAVAPRHRELVRDICERLKELHEANRAYAVFADALVRDGVRWIGERPMWPRFLGDPSDHTSEVARYLREAVKAGYIDPNEIPKELRP